MQPPILCLPLMGEMNYRLQSRFRRFCYFSPRRARLLQVCKGLLKACYCSASRSLVSSSALCLSYAFYCSCTESLPCFLLSFSLQFCDAFMLLLLLAGGLSFLAFGLDPSQKSNYIIGVAAWVGQTHEGQSAVRGLEVGHITRTC